MARTRETAKFIFDFDSGRWSMQVPASINFVPDLSGT